MGQHGRAGGRYIRPIDQNGATPDTEGPQGTFTLTAGTTYYYVLGGAATPLESIQITGYTAGLIITSATIQDCNHGENEVTDKSSTAGEWVNEDPSTGFVGVDGTGWTASNSVVAAAGTGVGGAMFHVGDTGAARTRLEVVVGGTGGKARVSGHAKD